MKVALCLCGLSGGKTDKVFGGQMWDGKKGLVYPVSDYRLGHSHYQKHIFAHNDIDVFIHTWNPELQKDLEETYKPKKGIYEKQIMFDKMRPGSHSGDPQYPNGVTTKKHITISRWYSIEKCVELKRQYEQEQGFTYDCVMIGRFDVAWLTDVHFDQFDMQHFYASNWCVMRLANGFGLRHENWYYQGWHEGDKAKRAGIRHTHIGYPHTPHYKALADYWFFTSSANMDIFGALHSNINEYLKKLPPSNHELAYFHLKQTGLLDKLKFAFHIHDDCHLTRHVYTDWRSQK